MCCVKDISVAYITGRIFQGHWENYELKNWKEVEKNKYDGNLQELTPRLSPHVNYNIWTKFYQTFS